MNPADAEAFRRAISHQQAQLGQHDQALQEITNSLRELSLSIASRLPVTPVPPVVPGNRLSLPPNAMGETMPFFSSAMLPGVRATAPDLPH